jgi:uncharacterized protein (AIM24 family)
MATIERLGGDKTSNVLFESVGRTRPLLHFRMSPGSTIIAEKGSFVAKDEAIDVTASFNRSAEVGAKGFINGLKSAAHRFLYDDKIAILRFHNTSSKESSLHLATPHLGDTVAIDLDKLPNNELICTFGTFIAGGEKLEVNCVNHKAYFLKTFSSVETDLQQIKGNGYVYLSSPGSIQEFELAEGQVKHFDPHHILGYSSSINLNTQFEKAKNTFLSDQKMTMVKAEGPGVVYIQSDNQRDQKKRLEGIVKPIVRSMMPNN